MKLELFQGGVKIFMSWHPDEKLLTRIFIIEFVMVPQFYFIFFLSCSRFCFSFLSSFFGLSKRRGKCVVEVYFTGQRSGGTRDTIWLVS